MPDNYLDVLFRLFAFQQTDAELFRAGRVQKMTKKTTGNLFFFLLLLMKKDFV